MKKIIDKVRQTLYLFEQDQTRWKGVKASMLFLPYFVRVWSEPRDRHRFYFAVIATCKVILDAVDQKYVYEDASSPEALVEGLYKAANAISTEDDLETDDIYKEYSVTPQMDSPLWLATYLTMYLISESVDPLAKLSIMPTVSQITKEVFAELFGINEDTKIAWKQ